MKGEAPRRVCLGERRCERERRRNTDEARDERTLEVAREDWASKDERRREGCWNNRAD